MTDSGAEPRGRTGTARETSGVEADETLDRTRRNFVLGLIALFALLSFLIFRPFVSYVFMGALLVYLTHPAYRRVLAVVRRPALAAASVLLLTVGLVVGPLIWVAFEVAETGREFMAGGDLSTRITDTVDAFALRLEDLLGVRISGSEEGAGASLLAGAGDALEGWMREHAGDFVALAGSLTLGVVVMLFVLYYGLKDGKSLVDFLVDASPLDDRLDRELIREVRKTVDAVFLGHIIVSAIQGALGGVGFLIFGVPNAVFWGFIMIVFSLIPVLGAFIVWAPAALWLLTMGETVPGIGLVLWGLFVVSTVDNVLRPKIVGTRADIHPVLVLVGVLGGLTAFGFIGFVLGPLVLAMFVAIINFWRRDYLPSYEAQHRVRLLRREEADVVVPVPPSPSESASEDVPEGPAEEPSHPG